MEDARDTLSMPSIPRFAYIAIEVQFVITCRSSDWLTLRDSLEAAHPKSASAFTRYYDGVRRTDLDPFLPSTTRFCIRPSCEQARSQQRALASGEMLMNRIPALCASSVKVPAATSKMHGND